MDFNNKNVTVMGLGTHGGGEGLVRYLANQKAKVLVTDLKTKLELKPTLDKLADLKNVEYHLGEHRWSDFKNAKMIFINQAIPKHSLWIKKIIKAEIPVSSETNLFFENCPAQIIGVTGTNGKSTTCHLIFEILKNKYQPIFSLDSNREYGSKQNRIYFGGNIGGSLLGHLDKISKDDLVLLELSSYQLQDLAQIKKSPHISVILNITPDHLDIHRSFADYVAAKSNILKFQGHHDFAILNFDQPIIKKLAQKNLSHNLFFSANEKNSTSSYFDQGQLMIKFMSKQCQLGSVKNLKMIGKHNLENIMAASLVGILYQIKPEEIYQSLIKFPGLEHRIEFVGEKLNRKFYNDSKSTTPESTIAALYSFDEPLILICGGKDKNFDFSKLAKTILCKVKFLILLGESATQIKREVEKYLRQPNSVLKNIIVAKNLKEDFEKANQISIAKDIILLSPACSSLDQFHDFEERGKLFKKLVEEIKN